MRHRSRLPLLCVCATGIGGAALLGSSVIDDGLGASLTKADAAEIAAPIAADFPICHTPAPATVMRTMMRLAQKRTEVPPAKIQAVTPAPAFADLDPPVWDGLGSVTYRITTSSPASMPCPARVFGLPRSTTYDFPRANSTVILLS